MDDCLKTRVVESVLPGKLAQADATLGCSCPDLSHLCLSQRCTSVSLTTGLSLTRVAVCRVLCVCTDGQVGWLKAMADVAGVLDLESCRYGSDEDLVGEGVDASLSSRVRDLAIAIVCQAASPEQAFAMLDSVGQEPFSNRSDRILIGHRSLFLRCHASGRDSGAGASSVQCSTG